MGRSHSTSERGNRERRDDHRLHGDDAGNELEQRLPERIELVWDDFQLLVVTPFENNLYVLKMKEKAHYEHVECVMLQEHQHVALLGVLGKHDDRRSGRNMGYCLFFQGAPYIHRYIHYVGLAYSPATETKEREGRVIYEDDNVRLWRFGAGTFDYLLRSRKEPDFMKADAGVILTGDGAAHSRFSGIWKEGI